MISVYTITTTDNNTVTFAGEELRFSHKSGTWLISFDDETINIGTDIGEEITQEWFDAYSKEAEEAIENSQIMLAQQNARENARAYAYSHAYI